MPRSSAFYDAFAFFGWASHWFVFREALPVRGPFGVTRPARGVGVQVDEPQSFSRALCAT